MIGRKKAIKSPVRSGQSQNIHLKSTHKMDCTVDQIWSFIYETLHRFPINILKLSKKNYVRKFSNL